MVRDIPYRDTPRTFLFIHFNSKYFNFVLDKFISLQKPFLCIWGDLCFFLRFQVSCWIVGLTVWKVCFWIFEIFFWNCLFFERIATFRSGPVRSSPGLWYRERDWGKIPDVRTSPDPKSGRRSSGGRGVRRAGGSSGPRFDLNFGKSLDWFKGNLQETMVFTIKYRAFL